MKGHRLKYGLFLNVALPLPLALLLLCSCNKEKPAPLPIANFYASNDGCAAPCKVYFYDNSTYAVEWEWDFGNGFNSHSKVDSNQYNTTGFYDVTLRVWNVDGAQDSVVKTITIY